MNNDYLVARLVPLEAKRFPEMGLVNKWKTGQAFKGSKQMLISLHTKLWVVDMALPHFSYMFFYLNII